MFGPGCAQRLILLKVEGRRSDAPFEGVLQFEIIVRGDEVVLVFSNPRMSLNGNGEAEDEDSFLSGVDECGRVFIAGEWSARQGDGV